MRPGARLLRTTSSAQQSPSPFTQFLGVTVFVMELAAAPGFVTVRVTFLFPAVMYVCEIAAVLDVGVLVPSSHVHRWVARAATPVDVLVNVHVIVGHEAVKFATSGVGGGTLTVMSLNVELVPRTSVTVSVTRYVPAAAYVRELLTVVAVLPSPWFHENVALAASYDEVFVNVQLSPVQLWL